MRLKVELLPHQHKFLRSRRKFNWLKAGLGAGKTFALSHYVLQRMLKNPETLGLVAANTYSQLNNSILAEVINRFEELDLKYHYSPLSKILTLGINGAKVLVMSLEKYEQLRGIEFGWAAIDELAFARPEAYDVLIGRIRCKRSHFLEVRIASTPNGFNFLYDRFASGAYIDHSKTPQVLKGEFHEMISATAMDNPTLPKEYLDSLFEQYVGLFYKQEVLGEFVNVAQGLVYHAFDRSKNLKEVQNPIGDLRAACDFNVNPMTGIMANVSQKRIHIRDEFWLNYSNTFELAERIREKYPRCQEIVPDAAGSAEHTSATKSDHQILREAGFEVLNRRKNPPRKDRFNNTNRFLQHGWLTIDPKCVHLIEDLDRCTYDNEDESLGHISDALGYLCWNVNPFRRPTPEPRIL